jgi:uncharacterized protein
MHVNSGFQRIAQSILLFVVWAVAGAAFADEGLFWTAEKPGRPNLLLMPTVHTLPDAGADVNIVVAQAVLRANTVAIESPITEMTPAENRFAIQQELYPTSDNLENHAGAARLEYISNCAAKAHIPYNNFVRVKPFPLALLVMTKASAPPTYVGLEGRVEAGASAVHRPFFTLLSSDENMTLLASIPERLQLTSLYNACGKLDKYVGNQNEKNLITAWRKGDAQALSIAANEPVLPDDPAELLLLNHFIYMAGTKLFMDALTSERIQSMKGPILVAIGAGHFSGEASILDRLSAAGYAVKRVNLETLPMVQPGTAN